MKLPESERVIYNNSPLIEVVAQLKFPTILKILEKIPSDFQEKIRSDYPIFDASPNLQIPIQVSNALAQINPGFSFANDSNYIFQSEDIKWQLILNKDSITLRTTQYERYEYFIEKFKTVIENFESLYNPSFYSRVALKYRDLIVLSKLNIPGKKWHELIPQYISPELHSAEIKDSIQSFIKNIQVKTEFGQLNFQHGLVTARDPEKGVNEPAYLLDSDFFTEDKIQRGDNVWRILNESNRTARNLFRWSITDELHRAMEPISI
jgi:uncharacterized protein (TIGR04255 family)